MLLFGLMRISSVIRWLELGSPFTTWLQQCRPMLPPNDHGSMPSEGTRSIALLPVLLRAPPPAAEGLSHGKSKNPLWARAWGLSQGVRLKLSLSNSKPHHCWRSLSWIVLAFQRETEIALEWARNWCPSVAPTNPWMALIEWIRCDNLRDDVLGISKRLLLCMDHII